MKLATACLLAIGLLLNPPVYAEQSDLEAANKRVAELEAEVRLLAAQVKMLQAELAAAKTAASEAEARAEQAEAAAGAVAEDGPKTFASLQDILRELPKDLRPEQRGGWSKYKQPLVSEWFKTHPIGHRMERRLKITSVQLTRTPFQDLDSGRAWKAQVFFERQNCQFEGMSFTEGIESQILYGDSDFAKRVESVKSGINVRVTGNIDRVETLQGLVNKAQVTFHLSDCTIHHPVLNIAAPQVVEEETSENAGPDGRR